MVSPLATHGFCSSRPCWGFPACVRFPLYRLHSPTLSSMSKTYDHRALEAKWQAYWEQHRPFRGR